MQKNEPTFYDKWIYWTEDKINPKVDTEDKKKKRKKSLILLLHVTATFHLDWNGLTDTHTQTWRDRGPEKSWDFPPDIYKYRSQPAALPQEDSRGPDQVSVWTPWTCSPRQVCENRMQKATEMCVCVQKMG